MRMSRGRPRTRPPVRRVTLELDQVLLDGIEVAAGASSLRLIVEEALQLWLDKHQPAPASRPGKASLGYERHDS